MFLKELLITSGESVIREIRFHKGLNLIIDEGDNQVTGNSVGKTTVLSLIDFCLGGDAKEIYVDPETKKNEYKEIKDFLIDKKILITLVLKRDLDNEASDEIVIERNFLPRSQAIRKVNGKALTDEGFPLELSKILFPSLQADKPTFRQVISHNIRYKDNSINNTLKTLDAYTRDAEYETLYLYLFGCDFTEGNRKQDILIKLGQEESYKKRLEKNQTKSGYETSLHLVNSQIEDLNKSKYSFAGSEDFETGFDKINQLRYTINRVSSKVNRLNIRKSLILEAKQNIEDKNPNIDLRQLEIIYSQATTLTSDIHRTFEELVEYHQAMILEKIKFVTKELPDIEIQLNSESERLDELLEQERELISRISKGDSFSQLEEVISNLNENYRLKGEYENIIQQINESEEEIKKLKSELENINNGLFSDDFELKVKNQLTKFNKHFAGISDKIYGEKYAVKHDIVTDRRGQKIYKFDAFNTNMSSGKKQGEISCFDLAYILFAEEEGLDALKFVLNDKKELMDDRQLVSIANFVSKNNIQFVVSILKDKLPPELNDNKYFVVKLSQSDKLFKL